MIYDWRISIFHGCRLPQCTWEGNPMDTSSRSMQYPVPRSVDGQRTDKQIQAIQVGRASWWGPLDAWTTPAPSMACLFFWFEGSPRLLLVWLLTYGRIAEASSEFLGCSPGLPAKSISSDIHHPAVCSPSKWADSDRALPIYWGCFAAGIIGKSLLHRPNYWGWTTSPP
jgi:hypothetical protein